ncbi:MAG: hypothetical protein L3J91_03370, partial [Thermoplasmata archaeon]|nr:hypothetical protein [Thermoplasmata archaeon]
INGVDLREASTASLNATVKLAYQHGAQVLGHANGDAAIDLLLEAHEAAGAPVLVDRPRTDHGLLLVPRSSPRRGSIHSRSMGALRSGPPRPLRPTSFTLLYAALVTSGTRRLETLLAANLSHSTLTLDRHAAAAIATPRPTGRGAFTVDPRWNTGQRG